MSIAGALATTGAILTTAAIAIGAIATESHWRTAKQLAPIGWTVFALATGFLIAAAWTAALT